jgi:hypothetical protein
MVPVSDLERAGMAVVSIDRDGKVPAPEDRVNTKGWLRPRLWGRAAVLPVIPGEDHAWEMVGDKKRNEKEG